MALKMNFREVTPEDTEILRMIALRNGKAEDYLCCDVTNEDRVTQTTWYLSLIHIYLPNGLPKATTPLLSALTLTKPMCISTLFGVRSIWTVTENSETSGAVQRLLGV